MVSKSVLASAEAGPTGPVTSSHSDSGDINDVERNGWIPFSMPVVGHISLTATLNNVPVRLLFDSGAGPTLVDATLAKRLDLQSVGSAIVSGLTGTAQTEKVKISSLTIGSIRLLDLIVDVVDFQGPLVATGEQADVVIGRGLLQSGILDIDFLSSSMRVLNEEAIGALRLPSPLVLETGDAGRLYIPLTLERRIPVEAHYDLGSSSPIYLSPAYAADILGRNSRAWSKTATVGVEGVTVDDITTVRELTVAGVTFKSVPALVPGRWHQQGPALIGLPILSRFRNIIDLQGKRLWLIPYKNSEVEPFLKDRSGIGANRLSDRLRVIFIAPDSPAELAGLKAGDEIVAIDGDNVGPDLFARRPRPGAEPAGTREVLGLADGRAIEITLKDYF